MAKIGKTSDGKRVLNCISSRDIEKDWHIGHAIAAGHVKDEARAQIPESKDLREQWWSIWDQKNTGSCVGQASAAILTWQFVKVKRLAQNSKLSVRHIWMSAKEMDEYNYYPSTFLEIEGTSLKAALDIARKYGAVEDTVLPFEPEKLYDGEPETYYASAARYKILSYFNLRKDFGTKTETWNTVLTDWRTWIANKGPILTRLDVDDTWENANATRGNLDTYHKPPGPAGNAVAIVGYTKDRFIVRNSWGTGWGDKGFAYASLDYAKGAFSEAYGITLIP
ncbi:Papain family cysteine protease [uncultured archaeon]|nr:Papain family cysteine protease [uncultured archaeon]